MLHLMTAAWLVFTLPDSAQHVYTVPDPEGDSIRVECTGGPPIRNLLAARLYGAPVTGGGFRFIAEIDARGREGTADSFPVPWPGNFYVISLNAAGPSCPSNIVTVLPGDVTGAIEGAGTPDETLGPSVITCTLFDVQGRRIGAFPGSLWRVRGALGHLEMRSGVTWGRIASGIYFLRGRTRDGQHLTKRVVVVR